MHARYSSSADGFRPGSSYRNSNRGGFNRAHPKLCPSPHPLCKADIFMEAGRLAAEYLVSKGLIPPNSLPGKWPNGTFQEFNVHGREPPMPDGRTSAFAHPGNMIPDVGHGRRSYNDEYNNHMRSRSQLRGRWRNGPYSRRYSSEWGRENGRRGPWMERATRYPNTVEGEDDFTSGYQRIRRGEFDEVGSSVMRVGADERISKSESMGEAESKVENHEITDDTESKASSSSTRKDPPPVADVDVNKVQGDVKILDLETGDDAKSDASGDLKKNLHEEDVDGQPCAVEGDPVNKHGNLLKSCSFGIMPTKPRSTLAQRSPNVDRGPAETSNTSEAAYAGESEVIAGEEPVKGSSSDSQKNQAIIPECQASDISSTIPNQPMEESVDPQLESSQCPSGFGTSKETIDVREEGCSAPQHIERMEGNEYSSRAEQSSSYIEKLSTDEEMVEAVDRVKSVGDAAVLFPKVEPEFEVKLEDEKQLLPPSFKTCDLNLTGTPEIAVIPDDPMLDHLHTLAPTIKTGKESLLKVGLSIGNNAKDTDDYMRDDGKVVPVINLEDDSPMEDNACDSSKVKSEMIYSSLDNFLSQTEDADLPGIQDGYSLAFTEFLGTDISRCPSVQSDLNNLQMGGVPGDVDSMYMSLGEIPISFMEVWDQPPQEYGHFF